MVIKPKTKRTHTMKKTIIKHTLRYVPRTKEYAIFWREQTNTINTYSLTERIHDENVNAYYHESKKAHLDALPKAERKAYDTYVDPDCPHNKRDNLEFRLMQKLQFN